MCDTKITYWSEGAIFLDAICMDLFHCIELYTYCKVYNKHPTNAKPVIDKDKRLYRAELLYCYS